MNLQFKTLVLAAISVAVLSCKKKESEQIKLQPDEMVGAFVDTDFTFEAYSVLKDSTISGNTNVNRLLVGNVVSDEFGSLSSSAYTQLVIPENGFDIDTSAKNISANLILSKNYFYGKSDQNLSFLLYKLDESLSTSNTYYSNSSVKLGSFLQEINISADDALFTIPLNSVFKKEIRDLENNVNNQSELSTLFKGFTIQSTGGEALLGFSLSDSKIEMGYEIENSLGGIDTIYRDFLLGSGVAHFNKFSSTRSGTDFEILENYNEKVPSSSTNNRVLLQSGSRIETELNCSILHDKLFNTKQHIYKAELEVKLNQENFDKINESNAILLDVYDETDTIVAILSDDINSDNYVKYDITAIIQEVLAGNLKLNKLNLYTSFLGGRGLTVWIEDPNENIKLKVYFKED